MSFKGGKMKTNTKLTTFLLFLALIPSVMIILGTLKITVYNGNILSASFFAKSKSRIVASDDEDWGQLTCSTGWIASKEDFFQYVTTVTLKCKNRVMVGGALKPDLLDGEKWMCMDDIYNIVPGKCLSYSFGLSNDFSYEDDIDDRFNCKCLGFDHTSIATDQKRSPNIRLFKMGLWDKDLPHMKRYSSILKMNGHENATIDYLKIDIEGAELQFFRDVLTKTPNLLKNVKQMGIEIHVGHKLPELWRLFERLECLGFRVIFSHENLLTKFKLKSKKANQNICFEVVWARERDWR